MNIVFCSSEVFPFAKTGGLADVAGALPIALEKLGCKVSIFLPCYKGIDTRHFEKVPGVNSDVFRARLGKKIDVYLIIKDEYYNRLGLYGDEHGDFPDNLDRFKFLCTETLALIKFFGIKTDIVHCHDWQTALIPVYLKEKYKDDDHFKNTKTLLTIHNLAFQGLFPKREFEKLGLSQELFCDEGFEFFDKVSFLKAGIIYSDGVNTVSQQYALEIQTKEFGCGLENVLHSHRGQVVGILNGLDYDVWDPKVDQFLTQNFGRDDFADNKIGNKIALQKRFKLPRQAEVPLFGFVGRLAHQKGVDVILEMLQDLGSMDIQVLIQGVGSGQYRKSLNDLAKQYPQKLALSFEFDESLAHQIYAGCDFFLMPSLFEPCGLSQMISLAFGTIPIVYKTGGLADTINEFDEKSGTGNGFLFDEYKKDAFIKEINKAAHAFHQKDMHQKLIKNAFDSRFTWEHSANKYIKEYQCLLSD